MFRPGHRNRLRRPHLPVRCGPGRDAAHGRGRLSIRGPEAVFITHLHSDHTLGYPDLIFTSWVMGRKQKLQAYGPVGLKQMTKHIIAAWREDIHVRIKGLERQTKTGYRVEVHEFEDGVVYDHEGVRITAIPVLHGCWKQAFGFRIDTPERSIVISGDTRPTPALSRPRAASTCWCTRSIRLRRSRRKSALGGEVWPSYMREFHTSDRELGVIAALAQPKLLVLHHIVRHGNDDEELARRFARGGLPGRNRRRPRPRPVLKSKTPGLGSSCART